MGLEKLGIDEPNLIMAVGSYGGGVASTGGVCGCLLGGIAAFSRLYGRAAPDQTEDPKMWRLSRKLVRKFEAIAEPFGGTNCTDIARVDWTDKDQVKEFRSPSGRRKLCAELVGDTAFALGELIDVSK